MLCSRLHHFGSRISHHRMLQVHIVRKCFGSRDDRPGRSRFDGLIFGAPAVSGIISPFWPSRLLRVWNWWKSREVYCASLALAFQTCFMVLCLPLIDWDVNMQRCLDPSSIVRCACNKRQALDIDTECPLNDLQKQERRWFTVSDQALRNLVDAVYAKVQGG